MIGRPRNGAQRRAHTCKMTMRYDSVLFHGSLCRIMLCAPRRPVSTRGCIECGRQSRRQAGARTASPGSSFGARAWNPVSSSSSRTAVAYTDSCPSSRPVCGQAGVTRGARRALHARRKTDQPGTRCSSAPRPRETRQSAQCAARLPIHHVRVPPRPRLPARCSLRCTTGRSLIRAAARATHHQAGRGALSCAPRAPMPAMHSNDRGRKRAVTV